MLFPKINSIKFTRTVVNRRSSIYICSISLFLSSITVRNSQNLFEIYTTVPLHSLKMFENAPFIPNKELFEIEILLHAHRVLNTFYEILFDSGCVGH